LQDSLTSLAEKVAAPLQLEVILVEVLGGGSRSVVRVFIDKEVGISLDDCEQFSKRYSVALDVEDWIDFSYVLEVSSPGLDRPLVREGDYLKFVGRRAKLRIREPLAGRRNFKGKILGLSQGRLRLEVEPIGVVEIPLADVEKANLVVEF